MGRPSKLTDKQWGEIGRRLTNGEGVNELAREYKVNKAAISRRFSQQTEMLRNLANTIVTADRTLESLPVAQQSCVMNLVDQLKGIQNDYAKAAGAGAKTAAHLAGIAQRKAEKLGDDVETEALRPIAALAETANKSAAMASNLIAANKQPLAADERPLHTPAQLRRIADLEEERNR